jgi:hypothetical protein
MSAILLHENNSCRVVWDKEQEELHLECQENDSLGALYWKKFRTIRKMVHDPGYGGLRENQMYMYLVVLLHQGNLPNQELPLNSPYRRLEIDP